MSPPILSLASIVVFLVLSFGVNEREIRAQPAHSAEPLRVQVEIARGPHFAGQGFELEVGVAAGAHRPEVELPRIGGARAWLIGTDLKPIATSGIGAVVAQHNLFLSRFRVVASRPGTLEIPPIAARIAGRSGRSPLQRIEIQPVPLEGRPREFLGGVGPFSLEAEAVPSAIRFGQELKFRITVTGPAAWGSTTRPDLARAPKSGNRPRVTAEPDEKSDEPPSRSFVYRIRPERAGVAVLPPVAIAAFDPAIKRYVTKATSSVSVQVVEAPAFNPASIEDHSVAASAVDSRWAIWTAWISSAGLLFAVSVGLAWVRRRRRSEPRHGPAAARTFAARLARSLGRAPGLARQHAVDSTGPAPSGTGSDLRCWEAAHKISVDLTRYLEIGSGRPPGALTPIEARQGVVDVTGCDDLGIQAERLAADCDRALYGERHGELRASDLRESARRLFCALGMVKSSRRREFVQPALRS